MRESGGIGPQGVADRSDGPEGGQAPPAPVPATPRAAVAVGVVALAGWALVVIGGGGIDPGDGLGGPGPRAGFLALALGAALAAAALLLAWDRAALRAAPTRLALAGAGGLAAWSAASMLWAAAPDLAWIDANRQAIGVCALLVGLGVGALLPGAPDLFGIGLVGQDDTVTKDVGADRLHVFRSDVAAVTEERVRAGGEVERDRGAR